MIQRRHIIRRRTIHKHRIKDVHAYHFIPQPLQIRRRSFLQLATQCLDSEHTILGKLHQVDALTVEHRIMSRSNAHHVDFQVTLSHQLLPLTSNLFQQTAAHRADAAKEHIQHLVFAEEERVVNHIHALAQILALHHKRNVRFAGTLRTSNHTDTIASQRTKQFARNTWRMLHVLAYNGNGSQVALQLHLVHRAHLYLLGKFAVQHFTGCIRILVAHTDGRRVFRTGLTHHEHTDALGSQHREDALVHANHTHHRQTAHRNQRRALDGRNTLDGTGRIATVLRDDGARILWTERIFDKDRNILDTDRINRRRINHFRTEIAKFRSLHIRQLVDGVCRVDDTRVSCHEARHIRPYLQHLSIQRSCQDSCRVVAAATSQVGNLTRLGIRRDETASQTHLVVSTSSHKVGKRLPYQRRRDAARKQILSVLPLRLDKIQRIIPTGIPHQRGNHLTGNALTIRHDGTARLLRQILNQIDTLENALQLIQQPVHPAQQIRLPFAVGYHSLNHPMMPFHHLRI